MCHIKSGALINFITETPHGSDVADKPSHFCTHSHAIEIWLLLWENINSVTFPLPTVNVPIQARGRVHLPVLPPCTEAGYGIETGWPRQRYFFGILKHFGFHGSVTSHLHCHSPRAGLCATAKNCFAGTSVLKSTGW